jgi:hypothetical protein
MPPDVGDLVTFLGLCVAAVLVVPKRSWRSIPAHLRETAEGERVYAFGLPARCGPLADDVVERWFQLVRREWPRVVDLGVPLYVLGVVVEARGARRSRARDAAWRGSASALILEHLAGRQPESALRERLRERGLREPATKLTLPPPREFVLPPIHWRTQWDQEVAAMSSASAGAAKPEHPATTPVHPAAEPVSAEFEVHTLGEIRFCFRGEDIAPRFLRKWVLGYLWLYLLIREARRPGDRVLRGIIADELFPGQDPEVQNERVRRRLSELTGELQPALRDCIKMESGYVRLDLSRYRFDLRELLDLVRRVEREPDGLGEDRVAEIREALVKAGEEWLPGWEEIERKGTGGRGAAGELVAEVRAEVAAAHASLLRVLADWYVARGQAKRVIPDLEEGLRRRPDQALIATKLIAAYEHAGQPDLAARVRREYDLGDAQ